MKTSDPDQLNLFHDLTADGRRNPVLPVASYERVRDKLQAAAAVNQSLIRLQPGGYGSPWVIKIQSVDGPYSHGWKYYKKFDTAEEAKTVYQSMLDSGEYAEG